MLVLAVGGGEAPALQRIYETLIGAGIGVAVNAVIAPPLYVQPAGDALSELAGRMAMFLRALSQQLRAQWSRDAADRMLNEARRLGAEVERADRTLARAQESAKFNLRGALAREAEPRLRTGLIGMEHTYVTIRNLCRALLDRTFFVPAEQESTVYDAEVRGLLAGVVEAAADAIERVPAVTSRAEDVDVARAQVERRLAELHRRRDRLADVLLEQARSDRAMLQQHSALLTDLDRMRVEVEAAVRPPEPWRPELVIERQRRAMRRVVDTSREHAQRRRRRRRS